jgi:hypothetical protein
LYWYLVVELALQKDDRVMSKMYYKIMFKFQEQLELVRVRLDPLLPSFYLIFCPTGLG